MHRGDDEGWFEDPYQLHEERWYSYGEPTKLVRDAGVESHDPVPEGATLKRPLVRSPSEPGTGDPHDLRRADDPSAGVRPNYAEIGEVQKFKPLPPRE